MQKDKRQGTLLKLISENRVSRQDELAALLVQSGFSVTQSSVSRDLVELGIVKSGGVYTVPQPTGQQTAFGLKSLQIAGENLVVAKCDAGLASACAVRIDAAGLDEVAGTVAGDDTVFIAVRDAKSQKSALKRIWELFGK